MALLLFAACAPAALAQRIETDQAVVAEIGGAAGEAVSFNYDVRYPSQFGFRLGATLDPGSMDSEREPIETERDSDEPYSLLGFGHFFVSEGPFALEVGAGPVLDIEAGNASLRAAGHVGLRAQPVLDRFLLRVGYSPTLGPDGYRGFVAVGIGYEIPF